MTPLTLYGALLASAIYHDGTTVNLSANRARYVVGGLKSFDVDAQFALTTATIDNAVRQLGRTAPANADTIGSWLDSETSRVWLDYGTVHDTLEDALAIAVERGELAIWDSVEQVEIRV